MDKSEVAAILEVVVWLVVIGLKIFGVIAWSWWVVLFFPLIVVVVLAGFLLLVGFTIGVISTWES